MKYILKMEPSSVRSRFNLVIEDKDFNRTRILTFASVWEICKLLLIFVNDPKHYEIVVNNKLAAKEYRYQFKEDEK